MRVEHLVVKPRDSRYLAEQIIGNPNFSGYFNQCVGVLDGSHFPARVASELVGQFRGRKGVTQNVLFACDFDLLFQYIVVGWEGTCHDANMLKSAIEHDFQINQADSG